MSWLVGAHCIAQASLIGSNLYASASLVLGL